MKIAIFCSIFLFHFPQFVDAASKKVCFGYGDHPFTVYAHNGLNCVGSFDTKKDRDSGKQCAGMNARRWTGLAHNEEIFFRLGNGTEVGRATVEELTDFIHHDWVWKMKKRIYFSWDVRQITISAYLGTGHICTQQTEFDHLANKSYLEFFPDQWVKLQNDTGCDDNALVTFKINLEEVIGHVGLSELRNTMAMSLMVKKRVYFPIYNGQRYRIKALYQHRHENFTIFTDQEAQLERSRNNENNQRYLEIDPDLFARLQSNVWINFYRQRANNPNTPLGSATVAILREVGDIDFSGGARNFGSLSGGF
ncbi:hypothetical protein niasHS_008700 [Heterodera schachtii]|uniref:Uncharacterized protein n=1 Tax=Heterodera schachtii TaxID=97005 RepID=A0ABD2JAX3_HETSC